MQEDKWTPIQINTDNQEVRLFNKLCTRKRKEIKQKEKMKVSCLVTNFYTYTILYKLYNTPYNTAMHIVW